MLDAAIVDTGKLKSKKDLIWIKNCSKFCLALRDLERIAFVNQMQYT